LKLKDIQNVLVVETALSEHRFGSRWIPPGLIRPLKEIVANFVEMQGQAQRRDPNIDFSNFFKRDDLSKKAYRTFCGATTVRRVSKALSKHIEAVA